MAKITIGDHEFDSYQSVEDAGAFLAGDVMRATSWALRNEPAQARGLVSATRMVRQLPWCAGEPPAYDGDVPPVLAEVVSMLAADLLAKPKLFADASGNSEVKSAKAGSAQVEFFSPVRGGPPLPRALWDMLVNANLVCLAADAASDDSLLTGPFVSGISGGDCRPWRGRYADDLVRDDCEGLA